MKVSVIIPTCNRAPVLSKALDAYARQTGDHGICEVIVIDDGSKDETRSVVERHTPDFPFPLRYLWHQNKGAAATRNLGIRHVKGEVILFGDDDVIPWPDMVSEHVAWHTRHPEPWAGMLGFVQWDPAIRPTPFMDWSGLYGPQFKFGYLKAGGEIGVLDAYTCDLSFKSEFIRAADLFDESIPGSGWEDVEFAYRLYQRGCHIWYNPRAAGYHHKFESFEDTRKRIERWYRSWPVMAQTAAGRHIVSLWHSQSNGNRKTLGKSLKSLLRPMLIPLLRQVVDTRLRLPGRVYDLVFSYYVQPLPSRLEQDTGSTPWASASGASATLQK